MAMGFCIVKCFWNHSSLFDSNKIKAKLSNCTSQDRNERCTANWEADGCSSEASEECCGQRRLLRGGTGLQIDYLEVSLLFGSFFALLYRSPIRYNAQQSYEKVVSVSRDAFELLCEHQAFTGAASIGVLMIQAMRKQGGDLTPEHVGIIAMLLIWFSFVAFGLSQICWCRWETR